MVHSKRVWVYCILVGELVTSLAISGAAFAGVDPQPPQKYPVCANAQYNAQRLNELLKSSDLPSDCKNQALLSYRTCGSWVVERAQGLSKEVIVEKREEISQLLSRNSVAYLKQAGTCATQRESVGSVCGQRESELRYELANITNNYRETLASIPFDQFRSARESEVRIKFGKASDDLDRKIRATIQVRSSAEIAIGDRSVCYSKHSLYSKDLSEELVATALNPGRVARQLPEVPEDLNRGQKGADSVTKENAIGEIRDTALEVELKETVGPRAEAYLATKYGKDHLTTRAVRGLASTAVGIGDLVFSTVLIYLTSVGDAGHACDMVYEDRLRADIAGCPFGAIENPK